MAQINARLPPAARAKAMRKPTDENAVPALRTTKSNTSIPLGNIPRKATTAVVGLRGPPQRTALGDVSNKIPLNRQRAKDPLVEKGKSRVAVKTESTKNVIDLTSFSQKSTIIDSKPVTTATVKSILGVHIDRKVAPSEVMPSSDGISSRSASGAMDLDVDEDVVKEESDTDLSDDEEVFMDSEIKSGGNVTFGTTKQDLQEIKQAREHFTEEIDYWDTSMVAEYADDIFEYMGDLEIRLMPNPNYMDHQTEIEWSMRGILVDWLVQVHGRFHLLQETLFLCVNFIDRFLTAKVVSLQKLQLVGATALFIAAKYEEIQCPSVHEIVYMVDNGYTAEEVLKAERYMINMLNFELGWPGPLSFLRRVSKADDYDVDIRTLAKYLMEVTLMEARFLGAPASLVAAGTHWLAKKMLRKGDWEMAHVYYSNYTENQVEPFTTLLIDCLEQPADHHPAIFAKYSDKRYKRAAKYVEAWVKKGCKVDYSDEDHEKENEVPVSRNRCQKGQ